MIYHRGMKGISYRKINMIYHRRIKIYPIGDKMTDGWLPKTFVDNICYHPKILDIDFQLKILYNN